MIYGISIEYLRNEGIDIGFSEKRSDINMTVDANQPPEGYELIVGDSIDIKAADSTGAFRAVTTIIQLIDRSNKGKIRIPHLRIVDRPRFTWRGLMLDSSRHFQTVDEIKKILDEMARLKLNVLHWHLTDDHGWRLEIKKYPKLTSLGAWREQPPIGRYGGFYTQSQVKDLVFYALEREITIVPEIEIPGHSLAAVAAYPDLIGCDPKLEGKVAWFYDFPCRAQSFPPVPGAGSMCAGKDSTYRFIEDVLTEVLDLFPSRYIHIGGDEVDSKWWQSCPDCQALYKKEGCKTWSQVESYMLRRVEKFLGTKSLGLIGWDEILEGGLSPNASVMSWRGTEGGIKAAKAGHKAVMTPQKPLYLDHGQSNSGLEPAHWPGTETLKEIYEYEPVPAVLTSEEADWILGLQGNLWTCFTHTERLVQTQAFPRLLAIAETGWSPKDRPAFADFEKRAKTYCAGLEKRGIAYWQEPDLITLGTWKPSPGLADGAEWTFAINKKVPAGKWKVVFQYESGADALDIEKVELLVDGKAVSTDMHGGRTGYQNTLNTYAVSVPQNNKGITIRAKVKVSPWSGGGKGDSSGTITMAQDISRILPEPPVPVSETTSQVTQNRDYAIYDWRTRHQQVLERNRTIKPEIVMIGDSITHYWAGEPAAPIARSPRQWSAAFGNRTVTNLGFGWDRTENILWRLCNGELKGIEPKVVVILAGTNNLDLNSAEEIISGIDAICREIHKQLPQSKILLLGILPRADQYKLKTNLDEVNHLMQIRLHDRNYIDVFDCGNSPRLPDGTINTNLFLDGLHPNEQGYALLAKAIRPLVDERLK